MRFSQKVAVITGAGSGIGQQAAVAFANEGATVIVVDLSRENADETVRKIHALNGAAESKVLDISKEADVKRMVSETVAKHGSVDILVNNCGIYFKGTVLDTAVTEWEKIMAVNLTGAFLCTKYCAEQMVSQGKGNIINVASEAGIVGIAGQVAYNVSKAALISLTKSTAVDLARYHIRVNAISPGTTETALVKASLAKEKDPAAARKALEDCRPVKRLGKPEEIAAGILFLASEESGYATGSNLVMDGGYTAW
ncbi:MAG: SDR family NAD(P)-dependent oxidoreductase [Bacteroidota bacterium]